MNSNSVYNKLQKFASQPVSMDDFMTMLKSTSANNPMFIKWRTSVSPTHATSHTVYWGRYYSNSDQSVTKEEEGSEGSNEQMLHRQLTEDDTNEEEDNDQYGSELLDSVPVGGDDDFDDDAGGSFD